MDRDSAYGILPIGIPKNIFGGKCKGFVYKNIFGGKYKGFAYKNIFGGKYKGFAYLTIVLTIDHLFRHS